MSVTTKTGDKGETGVMGKRLPKDDMLIEAIGTIDELMAVLGIVMMRYRKKGVIISHINEVLFRINGLLAGYESNLDLETEIKLMEEDLVKREKKMEKLTVFLKTGGEMDGWINWGRTVCRRAERRLVNLSRVNKIDNNYRKCGLIYKKYKPMQIAMIINGREDFILLFIPRHGFHNTFV